MMIVEVLDVDNQKIFNGFIRQSGGGGGEGQWREILKVT